MKLKFEQLRVGMKFVKDNDINGHVYEIVRLIPIKDKFVAKPITYTLGSFEDVFFLSNLKYLTFLGWNSTNLNTSKIFEVNQVDNTNPLATQIGGNHYQTENKTIEYILENNIGFAEGNIIKYVLRWKNKGDVQDLEKARHYIDILISKEKGNGK